MSTTQFVSDATTNRPGTGGASRTLTVICIIVAALASTVAAVGLLASGGPGPHPVTGLRGSADLYGTGLYRFDTWLIGAGNRGTDAAVLLFEVPLLLVALALARRGRAIGRWLLVAGLGFFTYYYGSMCFATAYNRVFLSYVALFGLSTYGLVLAVRLLTAADEAPPTLVVDYPARAVTAYLFSVAAVLTVVWLPPPVAALLTGTPPDLVATYTTGVTWAIDLGIIVPLVLVAAVQLHRRTAFGHRLATFVVLLNVTIGVSLLGQGAAQLIEAAPLAPGEKVGAIGGFAVLTTWSTFLAARILRLMRSQERVAR